MLTLVIARYITDPQKKISLHQMHKHNESAEQIRLHWKILSDTLISINKSDKIELSIYIHYIDTSKVLDGTVIVLIPFLDQALLIAHHTYRLFQPK